MYMHVYKLSEREKENGTERKKAPYIAYICGTIGSDGL